MIMGWHKPISSHIHRLLKCLDHNTENTAVLMQCILLYIVWEKHNKRYE